MHENKNKKQKISEKRYVTLRYTRFVVINLKGFVAKNHKQISRNVAVGKLYVKKTHTHKYFQ